MAKWIVADNKTKPQLAKDIRGFAQRESSSIKKGSPNEILYKQITSLKGPLLIPVTKPFNKQYEASLDNNKVYGLAENLFGKATDDSEIDPDSLATQAPAILEVRIPAAA